MKRVWGVVAAALLGLAVVGLAVAGINRNWSVHANGAMEIPVRDTDAQAQAIFQLSQDGTSIDYKLIVANIENVTQAHIHRITRPDGTGPVAVWLYPNQTGPALTPAQAAGRIQGPVAEGTITAANFVGPLAGLTLADLVALMNSGEVYVNVHTDDGVAPANTGPGDFPGGEVRGVID